jgi:hypothetical protein
MMREAPETKRRSRKHDPVRYGQIFEPDCHLAKSRTVFADMSMPDSTSTLHQRLKLAGKCSTVVSSAQPPTAAAIHAYLVA